LPSPLLSSALIPLEINTSALKEKCLLRQVISVSDIPATFAINNDNVNDNNQCCHLFLAETICGFSHMEVIKYHNNIQIKKGKNKTAKV
jgi:hypothetical protein